MPEIGRNSLSNIRVTGTYVGGNLGTSTATGVQAWAHGSGCTASGSMSRATGSGCTASKTMSRAAGHACVASGNYSYADGEYCTASGSMSRATGSGCTASGNYSHAEGYFAVADKYSQHARACGRFAAAGDAQTSQFVVRNATSDGTQTELFIDGSSARITIADDTTWTFDILITARRTDADNESAGYRIIGVIDRNAGTVALVGVITKTVIAEDTVGWDVTAEADDTNKALVIKVTGEAAKSIQWVGFVRTVETTG